ncbi:MAG: helix-turn-helix domain-containing protein [Gammaproteobacteria bacterium]|nr:helix-turn-helix domain-containing protein [Gammaproteobacteria bacterium]NKB62992.1 helix-turn-helix domain-containing protein [Gammaproteobacteria bacterium]
MLSIDILFENLDITVHPFVFCCAENGTSLSLGPREESTIHYVLGGAGTLNFLGYPTFKVEAGAMIVAPAGTKHLLRGTGTVGQIPETLNACQPLSAGLEIMGSDLHTLEDGIAVVCGSVDALYRGTEGIFNYLPEPIMVQSCKGEMIWRSFDMIIQEMIRAKSGSRAMLRLLFQECLLYMLRRYSETNVKGLDWLSALNRPRLNKVIETIIENPATPYTLESLAGISMMSRSSFAAQFKEALGRSAMDFVKEVRLRAAAKMLVQTDLPVKSICAKVGYDSRSHFTKSFGKLFGASPGEYRASHTTTHTTAL